MNWSTADLAAVYRSRGEDPLLAVGENGTPKRNKFGAVKTVVDGITFDSGAEARAYQVLKIAKRAGVISDLKLQPVYVLQNSFQPACGGRQRAVKYRADFTFLRDGKRIVVDVKGHATATYKIKRKLFEARYPNIEFQEWK